MGYTALWVVVASGMGLLSGYVLSVPQFVLIALGSFAIWTSAAIYEKAPFWSWGRILLCMIIAAQVGYVAALGLRAFLSNKRHRNSL